MRLPLLAALLVAILAIAGGFQARAQSQDLLSDTLLREVERVEAAYPGLIQYGDRQGGRVVAGVNEAALRQLLDELAAGTFTPDTEAALQLMIQGLSRQTGTLGALGRNITQDISGAAASSGEPAVVRGVTAVLFEVMEDLAHPYSILAQDLLSEKMRCGAAAAGDSALVQEIATRTSPDRAWGNLSLTDGTTADRYGLHAAADLYSVIARGPVVIATGYFGTVAVSRDAGASFATPDTGSDEALYAAAFGPGDEVWAVGRNGTVLHSLDGGAHFVARPTPFDRHFFGVSAPAAGEALVVGDFGLQLRLQKTAGDAATERWRCLPRDEDIILGRIVPAGPDQAVVGEFGTIERLPGGRLPGRRGELTGVPDDIYLFDLWFDASGEVGIAVGLSGTVLRSEDGGATWAPVATEIDADLYGVGGAGSRVVVAGERGVIAVSDDAGLSFTQRHVPDLRLPFHDVAMSDPENGYLVGPRGLIVALRDDGAGARFEILRGPGTP